MEKISLPLSRAVVSCLVVIIFLGACVTVLVPVARAEETTDAFFKGWDVPQTGGGVHVDLITPPFMLPDTIADTTFTPGYYDKNGCPIGMTVGTKEAPRMRDVGFDSGAECRGACGPDCPTGRCKQLTEIAIENRDKTGTCWYYGVISCPSHTGCQEHDSCYDWCERNQYTHIWDRCHLQCNQRCFDKYGYATCSEWADLPGRGGKYATKIFDFMSTPSYDQTPITYSYPPRFLENPPTITTTSSTQTSQPVPSPTTIPSPATIVPTTTPVVTKTVSEPDVTLTLIWTGTSEGDGVNVEPEASGTCGRSGGQFQCSGKFPYGTKVTLTAIPNEGSRFKGWFVGCSGTGACTVTMDRDKTVEADFELVPVTTAIVNYQEYCNENYPGSIYNREEGTCEYHRPTPTSGAGGLNKPTLIPVAGGCCPKESCRTQIADATGGTPPYHFSSGTFAGGGAPPMGMIIGLDGYLTGTAPAVGTYSFSVCVTDIAGQENCGQSRVIVS
jgi:hypothetical protein